MIIRFVLDLVLPLASLLPQSATPYIAMVLAGFAIGILGHLSGYRPLIVAGIVLIFFGALVFPLAINLTESTPPEVSNPR
jgi:MFS family permease